MNKIKTIKTFKSNLQKIKSSKSLRNKIFFSLFLLLLARVGIFIPIPGINHDSFYNSVDNNSVVNFLNIFSGGGFSTIGIFGLGIVPYINSSIVIQLLTKTIPKLEKLQEEGDLGRQKISQLTRYLTLLWAVIQSYAISIWVRPYVFNWDFVFIFDTILILVTGSMLLLWISELITQNGIGNGASLLIFQNIISGIPHNLENSILSYKVNLIAYQVLLLIFSLTLMILVAILIQEGSRKITIVSAKQLNQGFISNTHSYLPLKINQSGIMPIIFASVVMSFPSYIIQSTNNIYLKNIFFYVISNQWIYISFYSILIVLFSYLYSYLLLNPNEISKNLQKMGVSIAGIRPGRMTKQYLKEILNKLTFVGSLFLIIVVFFPYIISYVLIIDINLLKGISVTSIIILVGVAIETAKQIQTYLISQIYDEMI